MWMNPAYRHVDGGVEASLLVPQLVGGGEVSRFLVGVTEEPSIGRSHGIHAQRVRDVQAGAHRLCNIQITVRILRGREASIRPVHGSGRTCFALGCFHHLEAGRQGNHWQSFVAVAHTVNSVGAYLTRCERQTSNDIEDGPGPERHPTDHQSFARDIFWRLMVDLRVKEL